MTMPVEVVPGAALRAVADDRVANALVAVVTHAALDDLELELGDEAVARARRRADRRPRAGRRRARFTPRTCAPGAFLFARNFAQCAVLAMQ